MAQDPEQGTHWRDALPTVVEALGDQIAAQTMYPADAYTPEQNAAFKAVGVERPDEIHQRKQGTGESN